jgi:acyl carrier protein
MMNHDDILKTLTSIIREVLELPELTLTTDTSAADVDEWDSMTHIQIIAGIEAHYKIRFALGELQTLKNVGDMIGLIQKKLAK